MDVKPLYDHVLILPAEEQETTKGGVYIPEQSREKPRKATIVAVGDGKYDNNGKLIPIQVKVGDTIIYKKWGLTSIEVDYVDYFFLKAEDILAIVPEDLDVKG